jgi:hypothetical protein
MNDLAQNNLTLGISKNDLAAAPSWLTFGSGPTEWGNRRSGMTPVPEGPTAHAMCENTFVRRSTRSSFQSDRSTHAAPHRLHRFELGLRSGSSAAHPVLT